MARLCKPIRRSQSQTPFPPYPSPPHSPPFINGLQSTCKLVFYMFSALVVLNAVTEEVLATHTMAYNCHKANFSVNQELNSIFRRDYHRFPKQNIQNFQNFHTELLRPDAHVPVFVFLAQLLRSVDVVYSHGLFGNQTANQVFVRHEGTIYTLSCPEELVTIIPSTLCFANDIVRVIDSQGESLFMDQNNFLTSFATPVNCHPGPVSKILVDKIKDNHILLQGSEGIAFALLKNNSHFDFTRLLNQNSTTELILIEERTLNFDKDGTSFITTLLIEYRKHAGKIQMFLLAFRFCLELTLVLAGLVMGLPFIKSLSLASSSIKKIIDFKSYINQHRLMKKDMIRKFHRQELGRSAELNLSEMTSIHLETVYSSILTLTGRISDIETAVNNLATKVNLASRTPSNTPSHTPTPSPSPSRRSSSPRQRPRLPGVKKIHFTRHGVAYRTK